MSTADADIANLAKEFTFGNFRRIFKAALEHDYQIVTVKQFFAEEFDKTRPVLVNRIDIDIAIDRIATFADIFGELEIVGSFYFRLRAKQYNLLSHANVNLVKRLVSAGHEVTLHSEIIDTAQICCEDAADLLRKEVRLFEDFFHTKVYGVASHGDMTPYNNLDFWQEHRPEEFGLLYEAYDPPLWNACRYVSDSEFNRWKSYDDGVLRSGDRRHPVEHFADRPNTIYLLTHPISHYWRHVHE